MKIRIEMQPLTHLEAAQAILEVPYKDLIDLPIETFCQRYLHAAIVQLRNRISPHVKAAQELDYETALEQARARAV